MARNNCCLKYAKYWRHTYKTLATHRLRIVVALAIWGPLSWDFKLLFLPLDDVTEFTQPSHALMSLAMIFLTILSSTIGEAVCLPRKHLLGLPARQE